MQKTLVPPFAPKEKKTAKKYIPALIGIAFLCLAVFFAAVFIPEGKTEEEYIQELIDRKEAGEFLASGEEKDYCILMATLRDSIVLSCLPVLEGINWERPPKSPESLGPDWQEATHPEEAKNGNRQVYQHKKYPKILLAFDRANPDALYKGDKAFALKDHWQRFNPNGKNKKKDYYLDKRGKPVPKGDADSHIVP